MPVTRKPPVGVVNKKMAQKGDQCGDYYQDDEEDRVYSDASARSSPGARRRSYHDKEEELSQDDLQSARSSSVGNRRGSCHQEVEENQREFGERSSHHESGEDDWILVDPKTDREFMDTIRRRILQCVSTNSGEEDQGDHEDQKDQKAGEMLRNVAMKEAEDDWEDREKRELRASLSSLNMIEDKGWDVKAEMRIIPRNDNDNDDDGENYHEDKEKDVDNYPSRQLIANFTRDCSLFQEDEHRQELMNIVKSYIKKVKKESIMDIIDTILSEDEDTAEDAIFLISEVLYGK